MQWFLTTQHARQKRKNSIKTLCHGTRNNFQFLNKMEMEHPRKEKKNRIIVGAVFIGLHIFKSVAIKYKLGCHTRRCSKRKYCNIV